MLGEQEDNTRTLCSLSVLFQRRRQNRVDGTGGVVLRIDQRVSHSLISMAAECHRIEVGDDFHDGRGGKRIFVLKCVMGVVEEEAG